MWKKWLAFAGMLTLIILLDPTHSPGQPGGGGKGKFGGGGFPGQGNGGPGGGMGMGGRRDGGGPGGGMGSGMGTPGGMGMGGRRDGGAAGPGGGMGTPGGGMGGRGMGGPGGGGMGNPGGPGGGMGGRGMGGPGGGMGNPGGSGMGGGGMGSRGSDPEQSWQRLQSLTSSTGDTIDLSKISPETRAVMVRMSQMRGTEPLPERGTMSKADYLAFHAKNEARRAANGGGMGGPGGPGGNTFTMTMNPDGMGGRGMSMGMGGRGMGMGDPNNWQGNWNQGGWDPSQGGFRPPFEKKETEEEKPVAMRYGKLPKDLPGWYDELDLDKDGQVSLYEWRKAGKDTTDFLAMDLNSDGLVTADEYLRFTRKKTVETKVKAYEDSEGADRPKNWGLGAPVDAKGADGKPEGKGKWGPGGWQGMGKGGGGDKGGDKGERGGKGNGNPFRKW